jgi:hypothetical protein
MEISLSIKSRLFGICILSALASAAHADVFTCGKAAGAAIYSMEGFKVIEDSLPSNEFRILTTSSELSFIGIDGKLKTVAQTLNTISAIATTKSPMGDVLLLYTFDRQKKVLYISTHKDMTLVNGSGAGTYVSRCK